MFDNVKSKEYFSCCYIRKERVAKYYQYRYFERIKYRRL